MISLQRGNKQLVENSKKDKTQYTFAELRDYMTELERRETRVVHMRKERRRDK
jgi:hypothetical protein